VHERVLTVPEEAERKNLAGFIGHALRLDESTVIRMRRRGDAHLSVWASTGFDALATRTVAGTINPDDTSAAGDQLLSAVEQATSELIDPGFAMDSAWRGALPPMDGFEHLDDVPARVLIELAQRGNALALEHGSSHGPPASLLDRRARGQWSVRHGRDLDAGYFCLDRNGIRSARRVRGDDRRHRPRADRRLGTGSGAGEQILGAARCTVRFDLPSPRWFDTADGRTIGVQVAGACSLRSATPQR